MQASVVELRYRMNDVLKALDRNERVEVLYRGKVKGVLSPCSEPNETSAKNHPLFGSVKSDSSVEEIMNDLRGGRHVV